MISPDARAMGRREAEFDRLRAENERMWKAMTRTAAIICYLADHHHRTLSGSRLHDPERIERFEECVCFSCRKATEALRDLAPSVLCDEQDALVRQTRGQADYVIGRVEAERDEARAEAERLREELVWHSEFGYSMRDREHALAALAQEPE